MLGLTSSVAEQIRHSFYCICLCSPVDGHSTQRHLDSCNRIGLVAEGNSGTMHQFMLFVVVLLTKRSCQLRIVIPACRVMVLNAQDTWRNCEAQALTLLLSRLSPRCPNWVLIPHAAPPFAARYRENSERAGSMDASVRPSVTSSTPAIFFPCHGASASRFPRK